MSSGRQIGTLGRAGLMLLGAAALFAAMVLPRGAAASSEQPLYSFCAQFNCADGLNPEAGLIMDAAGNLYGTTISGGTGGGPGQRCGLGACGTVFKLAPDGTETVLYSFCQQSGCADGRLPSAGLIMDAAENLYGTTTAGGTGICGLFGCGTVFRLAPDGTYTVLYNFCTQANCADGSQPRAGLIIDVAGNLYGTTRAGGIPNQCFLGAGCGTVFALAPDGTETVLYSFCAQLGCIDGANPAAGLVMDAAGNLYGTTEHGGSGACGNGCGTVFKLAPDGTETVRYRFAGFSDGALPLAGLVLDDAGNLYGTTPSGGTGPDPGGDGVVFRLAPDGTYTVLYNFCTQASCADGAKPFAGMIIDAAGNLYGTTYRGGNIHNAGVAFELAPDGTETVLYSFCSVIFCFDGAFPAAGLIMDAAGNLYGTTEQGGGLSGGSADSGVVFELIP